MHRLMSAPVCRLELKSAALGGRAILGEIDLSLAAGETLAVTGRSGVGKSTLLRILAGLETGFRGRLTCSGTVAMVFQEPTLLRWRRVAENLMLTARISRDAALDALAEVGLDGLEERYPDQLSLGQQRRLSLARAFAREPDLLLLDEPFVSLDPATADDMMRLFARLRTRRRVASVLVTHVEEEAEKLASRIAHLAGAPARIASERRNRATYVHLATVPR